MEIVRAAIAAFNRRDLEGWDKLSHPDAEVDWSESRGLEAGIYRGRAETHGFMQTFEIFERVVIGADQLIDAGDAVVVRNTSRFTGREGIETIARSAFVYELRGGRIVRIRLYQDLAEALQAVGLAE